MLNGGKMKLGTSIPKGAIIYDHDIRLVVTFEHIHVYKTDKSVLHSLGTIPKLNRSPLDFSVNELISYVQEWLRRN